MGEYFPPTGGMAPWHSRPARLPLPDMTSAPIADTSAATAEADPEAQAKLSGYQRFQIASHYARRFNLPLPHKSIAELKKLVPDDFDSNTPAGKAWVWLVAHGRTPTPEAVARRMVRAARQPRKSKIAAWVEREQVGPKAAAFIAGYLAAHGTGPLWRELGIAMGCPKPAHNALVMQVLHHEGWVTSTTATRSLRPGPKAVLPAPAIGGQTQPG